MSTIKEIIDAERWSLVLQHFDYTAEQHNASLDRIYMAVIESEMALINQIKLWSADCTAAEKHITELEKQVGSVNDALSILDLVQVVPLVNGLKERIAEMEVQLINQSDWYVEWKKWEETANELKTVLNEVVDYYSKQGTGKVYNLGYSGDTQKEMKLKKAIGK